MTTEEMTDAELDALSRRHFRNWVHIEDGRRILEQMGDGVYCPISYAVLSDLQRINAPDDWDALIRDHGSMWRGHDAWIASVRRFYDMWQRERPYEAYLRAHA